MKLADQIKVCTWMNARKDTLLQHSQTELARNITADTGVKIHAGRVGDFEKSLGIERQRGNVTGKRKDRGVVLATELIKVLEALQMPISDDLYDILKRK